MQAMNKATFLACTLAAWALAFCGELGGGAMFYALAALCVGVGVYSMDRE